MYNTENPVFSIQEHGFFFQEILELSTRREEPIAHSSALPEQ